MNRRELVKAIAAYTDNEIKQVDAILQGFTDVVTAAVSKGEPVSIPGFAKFVKVDRPARWVRNPRTGERIRSKPTKRPRVTVLKSLKEAVANPASAPKVPRAVLDGTAVPKSAAKRAAAKKAAGVAKASSRAKKAPAKKAPASGRRPAKATASRR
jgi:DNA-binding protein HU-beta